MIFTSFEYAGFLALTVVLNWVLPPRARPVLLLLASYAFYASWSVPGLGILIAAGALAWGSGLVIPRLQGTRRTVVTAVSVVITAGSLVAFKLVEAIAETLDDVGPAAEFAIPVGLSFFCFQAISYLVDIHRGELEPHRSPVDVALYLAFFPHLLAGPIVRARKLIPAFHATPRWPDRVQWSEAAELILVGVGKKVALADPIFALCIDSYRDPASLGPANALVLLGATLIGGYFDVTGYIDIARGSAKLLGIDMQRNSLYPLTRSTGYADFWRRWQLTVMMWFRDYIFKPLRGDGRSAPWREHLALFGTFAALGAWHGFTVGWVLWGLASGVIIVGERTLQTRRSARRRKQVLVAKAHRSRAELPKPPSPAWTLARTVILVLATFPLVTAGSLGDTGRLYGSLVNLDGSGPSADLLATTALAIAALVLLDRREQRREAKAGSPDPATVARALAFGAVVLAVIVSSGPAPKSFLYFAF